jgi:hypothetical protein
MVAHFINSPERKARTGNSGGLKVSSLAKAIFTRSARLAQ